MTFFITEKETEDLLVLETRELVMPNGSSRCHTTFRLVWQGFDTLTRIYGYSEAEIVGLSLIEVRNQGFTFQRAFDGMVGWLLS